MNDIQALIDREIGLYNLKTYDNILQRLVVTWNDSYHGISPSMFGPDFNPEPPIFACRFAEKQGYEHFIAIANEDGGVAIQNTWLMDKTQGDHPPLHGIQCHQNAVFDLAWMSENMKFVTVSGDHTAILWDIGEGSVKKLQAFYGHTKSVKTVTFRPQDCSVFATGARDGKILIWDLRANLASDSIAKPDNSICNCHPTHGIKTPISSSKRTPRASEHPRANSITGLIFQDDNTLISCADGDGNIKVWDLRKNYSVYKREPLPKQSIPYCGSSSKNGYTNLLFDKSRYVLYANCMDNVIYSFNITTYNVVPEQRYVGHENGTFYIKASLSPEGNYLVSGSSDEKAYIWNVKYSQPIVQLEGHSAEVTCASWCQVGDIKIVTCSDDARHKIWRIGKEFPDSDDFQEYRGTTKKFPTSENLYRTLDQTPQSMKRKSTEIIQLSSKKKCYGRISSSLSPGPSGSSFTRRSSKRSLMEMLNGVLPALKEENLENEPNTININIDSNEDPGPSTSKKFCANSFMEGCVKLDPVSNNEEHNKIQPDQMINKYNSLRTPIKSPKKLIISPRSPCSPRNNLVSPGLANFDFPNFVLTGDAPHLGLMSPPKKICKSIDWLTRLTLDKNIKPGNSSISPKNVVIPPRRNSGSKSDCSRTPGRSKVNKTLLNYFSSSKSAEKKNE